jgi:hypothetical protein
MPALRYVRNARNLEVRVRCDVVGSPQKVDTATAKNRPRDPPHYSILFYPGGFRPLDGFDPYHINRNRRRMDAFFIEITNEEETM